MFKVRARQSGRAAAISAAALLFFSSQAQGGAHLPVYLEDSHAGSFYWCAANIPLDKPHTLVLFDAHSDASEVFDSDVVREKLRTTPDRAETLTKWRKAGAVQCFNWIEPLMPLPFERVIWVVPDHIDREIARDEVSREINAHEVTAPRAAGDLTHRFEITTLEELSGMGFTSPVVVSLDLDFFAELKSADIESAFETVWGEVIALPGLTGITAAISRPYLKSAGQADELVYQLVEETLRIANARLYYEPFASAGPDRSRMAVALKAEGKSVPAFAVSEASMKIRSLLAANSNRVRVTIEEKKWKGLVRGWDFPEIEATGTLPDHDGAVRVKVGSGYEVRTVANNVANWFVLRAGESSYNLLGKGTRFAGEAPPWIRFQAVPVATRRAWIDEEDLLPFLDPETGWGTVRVRARIGESVSNELIVRVSKSEGFRGAVEEAFGLPYLLGGSELRSGVLSGPDLALGGDCANLAIYALRRNHCKIPWMTPPQFRPLTETIDSFDMRKLNEGLFADFGTHLAVMMEDREPFGEFSNSDLFAHHLEGLPEVTSLSKLKEGRAPPRFTALKPPEQSTTLILGGDVMLARTVGEALQHSGGDPFIHIRDELQVANLAIVNLECAIVETSEPVPEKLFVFQAPREAAGALAAAGIDWVSLANNHSEDAGKAGLQKMVSLLEKRGVGAFGFESAPFQMIEVNGLKIALLGLESGDSLAPIRMAEREADFTVVMPHWGVEYQEEVSEAEVELAERIVKAGADLIVGSGPHCVQKSDQIDGVPVFYSLGNLVFDGEGPDSEWKRGMLLEVILDKSGRIFSGQPIHYQLDEKGFPKIQKGSDLTGLTR